MVMKKVLSIIAAVAALALASVAFTSCDKHAYSISTNHFAYMDGSRVKEMGQKFSIDKGSSEEIFAVYKNDTRITDPNGVYSASSESNDVARVSVLNDGSGILLEGVSKGSTSVTFNFEIYGFKLYKTVTVTVK